MVPNVSQFFRGLASQHLKRVVRVTLLLPPRYARSHSTRFPLLLVNDGQDFPGIQLASSLENLYREQHIRESIIVGIHANGDRLREYGTAGTPDYAGRGDWADRYQAFVLQELIPYLENHLRVSPNPEERFCAGFSLGGLAALDLAWQHPDHFAGAGIFSGSLWWRSRPFVEEDYDDDRDRIMHDRIRQGTFRRHQRFWLQAGTEDETSDRNNNGIIDAIDDTLDLIRELEAKGFETGKHVVYHEEEGGKHDLPTWGKVMPVFLRWWLPQ